MVTIRAAGPDDAASILRMIRQLATYEREPDAVEATEERLRAQLSAARPPFECLLVADEVDGEQRDVGMALFFTVASGRTGRPGIHLEDLWVDPAARGRGLGTALLAELARLVRERDATHLQWAVLDWNTPAIEFYDRLGADALPHTTHRVTGERLAELAAMAAGRGA